MKQGILIVSFGTTYKETREKNIERLAATVRENFPDWSIYQAYSSNKVRSILKTRDNIVVNSTREALKQMKADGVNEVAVLPTHIIDGIENNLMKQVIKAESHLFQKVSIASALLEGEEYYKLISKALWQEINELAQDDPVIFMGHGSSHEADGNYEVLEAELRAVSGKEVYIATVEGSTTIEAVVERLNAVSTVKGRVLLLPFMLVAGDHAINDMAGEEDSFASLLIEKGYQPECILKGIGEYAMIRNIYIRHLREAIG